jgi:hypothetical protein
MPDVALQCDAECKVRARVHRVAKVVHAVNLNHKNVLRVEPVAGPRVDESERITSVLKAAIGVVALADAKRVFPSKIGLETVCGNTAPTVTTSVLHRLSLPLLCVLLFLLAVLVFLLPILLCRLVVLVLLLCVLLFLPGVLVLLLRVLLLLLCCWLCFLFGLGFLFFLLIARLLSVDRSRGYEGQRQNCGGHKSN